MSHSKKAWPFLLAGTLPDIGLFQEALKPPHVPYWSSPPIEKNWNIQGSQKAFVTAIIGLTDRFAGSPVSVRHLGDQEKGKMAVSLPGTLAGAEVELPKGEKLLVFSAYARWEYALDSQYIFADASAHRIISDISVWTSKKQGHKVIVAGDWNILYGYGEFGNTYWKERYDSVFSRMDTLGLPFLGPQHPGGIQAHPWPSELPAESKNVPTFRKARRKPASAERQIDFVFASRELHKRLNVCALNLPDEWGPSDHCRILIELR